MKVTYGELREGRIIGRDLLAGHNFDLKPGQKVVPINLQAGEGFLLQRLDTGGALGLGRLGFRAGSANLLLYVMC